MLGTEGLEKPMMAKTPTYEGLEKKVKRLEKQINDFEQDRKSIRYFESAVKQSMDGLAVVDLDGNILSLNEAFAQMHGYTNAELIGKNNSIFHTSEQMPAVNNAFAFTKQDGKFCGEIWHVRRDGTLFPTLMTSSLYHDDRGKLVGLVATCRDITEEKKKDEELKNIQRLLDDAGELAKIGGWQFDVETQELIWTAEVYSIHGVDKTYKPTMLNVFTFYTSASRPVIEKAVRLAIEEGEPFDVELEFVTAKGKHRWIHTIGKAYARDGKTKKVIGTIQDITERRSMEERLRHSEAQFQLIARIAPAGIFLTTPRAECTYLNDTCCKMSGLPFKENLGTGWFRAIHPADRQRLLHDWRKMVASRGEWRKEFRFQDKTGKVTWVYSAVAPQEDAEGNIIQYVGANIDITERKQAERCLRDSERNFAALADNAYDGMVIVAPDGRHLFANPRAAEITGYSVAELLDTKIWQLGRSDEVAIYADRLSRRIKGEIFDRHYQTTIINKAGVPVPVDTTASRTIWQGQPADLIIIRDITDRKKAEAEQYHLKKQLLQAKKNEALSCMAGAIAHQFNNQLGVIMGNLGIALADLPCDAVLRGHLTSAMLATHRSAEIAGLMLTYLGQNTEKLMPLDLSEVCLRHLAMFQAAIPKNIALTTDLPSPGPIINANAKQLKQILTHLIANAYEAIGNQPGKIHMAIKIIPAYDTAKLPLTPLNWAPAVDTVACLEITDSGCGVTEEVMESLFDPFFSTKCIGRGIGLPVVLGILRSWNGAVSVESKLNQGSTFRVLMPLVLQ